jgi:hypothetical protein
MAALLLSGMGENLVADPTKAIEKPKAAAVRQDGWVPMTNGRDLSGWRNPFTWGEAKVSDGEIHLQGDRKFFLVTEKTYGDFIFEGEVFLPAGDSNSGIMFRAHVAPNRVWGYQAEVDGDEKRKWSGGLYDEGRSIRSSVTTGTGTGSPASAVVSGSRSTVSSRPMSRTAPMRAASSPSSTMGRRVRCTASETCASMIWGNPMAPPRVPNKSPHLIPSAFLRVSA